MFLYNAFPVEQKIAPVIEDKYDSLLHSVRLSERHRLEVCFWVA